MLGTALAKKEDRLVEAASLMLKSGNFQEYCDIQMQLGNFEEAIAVAPKVNMRFWNKCVTTYKNKLLSEIEGGSTSMKRAGKDELIDPVEELI